MEIISLQTFFIGLMVTSTLASLVTEAVKKILKECNTTYHANTLNGLISAILSTAIGIGYILFNSIEITVQSVICIIALAFLSWLCSMVGYDKVAQTLSQIKTGKGDGK